MTTKTVKVEITGDPSGFNRSMQVVSESGNKAAGALEGHASRIGGAFSKLDNLLGSFGLPFTGALGAIGGKISELETKGSSSFQKLSSVGGAALLGVAAGAAVVGAVSIKLADDFETAHARLENAIHNTGAAYDVWSSKIDSTGKKLESLGYNATDFQSALVPLVGATHDTGKALDLMGLAADIAAGRHISLGDATTLLTKVETGHVALLGRMGIATKDANGHTIDTQTAVERLTALYGGAAARNAETFHGKVQVLTAQMQDLGIKIGQFLIPIITALAGAMSDAINWFEKHRAVAIALGAVIGGALLVAIAAYTASMISAAIATIAATWPILAIIAAIALVVAAAIFLWTHWDQVWNWIKDHPAYAAIIAILAAPIAAFVAIVGAAHWLYDNWNDVWNGIQSISNTVAGGISSALQPVIDTIDTIVGAAHDAYQALSDLQSFVTGSSGSINDVTNPAARSALQKMGYGAEGAIVTGPTLAMIGEAGPEAVVPLNRMPGSSPLPGNGSGADSLIVQIHLDGHRIGEHVIKHINRRAQGAPVIVKAAVRS